MQTTTELEKKLLELEQETTQLRAQLEAERAKKDPKQFVNSYADICKSLDVPLDDRDIVVQAKNLTADEAEVGKYLIKMMRIAKVYNQGWLPKRGEKRYYAWANLSGSGFVFYITGYDGTYAHTASAARLCFKTAEDAKDAFEKHKDIYRGFIGLG